MKPRDDNKVRQIFDATLKLVVKSGVAGVTMRQIAREAGLATGTLYIYFKDKDELISQLYSSCRAAAIDAYFKAFNENLPYKKGFNVVWNNILQHRLGHFDEYVFMEQSYHSPFISASAKEMSKQLLQPLIKLIDHGKEKKLLKDLDTMLLLIFMVGSITEVIKYVNYHKKKITPDMVSHAFTICWDGLKR